MWYVIALGYCLACLLLSLLLTHSWSRTFAETAASRGLSFLRHQWLVVVFTAIIMPYALWVIVRTRVECKRHLQTLRQVGRSYRPYEFERVNNFLLAKPIREQFELHTPALIKLGYELLADFRMKPEPVEVYDRIFLSSDGAIVAAVTALLGSGAMGLISVLQDGTSVHTTSANNPRPERTLEPADRLSITYLPEASVQNLHDHHVNTLRELSASRSTSVMGFRKDQFREVMVYDQLIFCRWRYRHGGLDQEPPTPDFRTLRALSGVLDLADVRLRI